MCGRLRLMILTLLPAERRNRRRLALFVSERQRRHRAEGVTCRVSFERGRAFQQGATG